MFMRRRNVNIFLVHYDWSTVKDHFPDTLKVNKLTFYFWLIEVTMKCSTVTNESLQWSSCSTIFIVLWYLQTLLTFPCNILSTFFNQNLQFQIM